LATETREKGNGKELAVEVTEPAMRDGQKDRLLVMLLQELCRSFLEFLEYFAHFLELFPMSG
jgi:hypothetical protein